MSFQQRNTVELRADNDNIYFCSTFATFSKHFCFDMLSIKFVHALEGYNVDGRQCTVLSDAFELTKNSIGKLPSYLLFHFFFDSHGSVSAFVANESIVLSVFWSWDCLFCWWLEGSWDFQGKGWKKRPFRHSTFDIDTNVTWHTYLLSTTSNVIVHTTLFSMWQDNDVLFFQLDVVFTNNYILPLNPVFCLSTLSFFSIEGLSSSPFRSSFTFSSSVLSTVGGVSWSVSHFCPIDRQRRTPNCFHTPLFFVTDAVTTPQLCFYRHCRCCSLSYCCNEFFFCCFFCCWWPWRKGKAIPGFSPVGIVRQATLSREHW